MPRTITTYGPGGFDPTKPNNNVSGTREVDEDPVATNADAIRDAATQALATNRAYIASTPTAAAVAAQTKALSRQVNGVIRLLLGQFDATD